MTAALTKKRYTSTSAFLKDTEPSLRRHEFPNIFVLVMAQAEIDEGGEDGYCAAVWDDQDQLVFALVNCKHNTMLYGSWTQNMDAVDLLVDDLVSTGAHTDIEFAHAFQPSIGRLHEQLAKHNLDLRITDPVWAYESQKVIWSPRLLAIARDEHTELKVATLDELALLTRWLQEFLIHLATVNGMDTSFQPEAEGMAREAITNQYAHILYIQDVPVSMCWMRRPTETECAIAMVYTPKESRGKGYGAVCVGLLTEKLLKTRRSVNLFVARDRDVAVSNMYAGIGYQLVGEATRLRKKK
ncbi:hypothetical protein V8B55DRAFT_1475730 [Mucor lusitanicus]|uniref:N-acetyltransferase domain-containing protein n=2 Tax=Mucor circinelloides f. lusitanicus TaxID=29924 RepID=A0A162R303_MUCCL|nr:hypothetical protein FB192DRAFT_1375574 [Mucor lusitanicus]OAD07820.1 hypothetical protein MUCCIDRAFT_77243 [Mucor lusitanicus CBS 277.49]